MAATGQVVHTSAHPSLPPARAEQVVQYLLARNYHLTALELLVESQAAGHDSEFPELELFFGNADRFPPEEVAKCAQADGLELQQLAQSREQQLQLLEYELRVAKEDLAALGRRVSQQNSQPGTPNATSTHLPISPRAGQDKHSTSGTDNTIKLSITAGAHLSGTAACEPNLEAKSDQAGSGTNVLSEKTEVQRQPQPQPQPQQPATGIMGVGKPGAEQLLPQQSSSALEDLDWSQLGQPTEADQQAVVSAMVAYCLQLGLRTSALTLKEEAADALPGITFARTSHPQHQLHASGQLSNIGLPQDGQLLWRWYKLAVSTLAQQGADALTNQAVAMTELQDKVSHLNQELEQLRVELAQAQEEAATARTAASQAKDKVAALTKQVDSLRTGKVFAELPPKPMGLLSTSSAEFKRGLDASMGGQSIRSQGQHPDASSGGGVVGYTNAAGQLLLDPEEAFMHQAIVGQLTELLPRIMPNLTIKTRLEILPMVQAVILAARDPELQRGLTSLVFNGVATPDPQQRGAVVALCAGLAARLGPAWAAQELLATCIKQVASPSTERRVLVTEMITALLDPHHLSPLASLPFGSLIASSPKTSSGTAAASGNMLPAGGAVVKNGQMDALGPVAAGVLHGSLIDCAAQAHAVLPALHRLAEDRMEQVREAAVVAIVALLQPGCLPFSRPHYTALEDMLMVLAVDTESVSTAALVSITPALQAWCNNTDLISTSLLPRVIAETSRLAHEANTAASATNTNSATSPGSGTQQGQGLTSGRPSGSFTSPPQLLLPTPSATGGSLLPTSPSLLPRASVGSGRIFAAAPTFNNRRFACWEHQAVHQLLELFTMLLPALRTSCLGSVPHWVVSQVSTTPLKDTGLEGASSLVTASGHLLRVADHDTKSVGGDSGRGSPFARPQQDHPLGTASPQLERVSVSKSDVPNGHSDQEEVSTPPSAFAANAAQLGLSGEGAALVDPNNTTTTTGAARAGSETSQGHRERSSGGASSIHTFVMHADAPSTMDSMGLAGLVQYSMAPSSTAAMPPQQLNVVHLVETGELDAHALFAAWAGTDGSPQWKRMQWILQLLLPELIELARTLGTPSPPTTASTTYSSSSPTGNSGDGGLSAAPYSSSAPATTAASSWLLHLQLARTTASLATSFGPGWSQAVLLPMYCSAAGCSTTSVYQGVATSTILEHAEQLAPQTAAAAQAARSSVLPHLLAVVLPYCTASCLSSWVVALTQVSLEVPPSYQQLPAFFGLLQPPTAMPHPQWLQTAQQQLAAAMGFVHAANAAVVPRLLQVLESLVQKRTAAGNSAPAIASNSANHLGQRISASVVTGLQGTVALAMARGLLPPAYSLQHSSDSKSGTNESPRHIPHSTSQGVQMQLLLPLIMPPLPELPAEVAAEGVQGETEALPLITDTDDLGAPSQAMAPVAVARKVMAVLMVLLSKGELEVQCGVVGVLLEVLLRYTAPISSSTSISNSDAAKLIEQVCVVYDNLLTRSAAHLTSTVLSAMQQVASMVTPQVHRSTPAAQLVEWVLGAVHALSTQLLPPPAPPPGTPPTPYPTDHQRHIAVQLLIITHAVFVATDASRPHPRLQSGLQACLDTLLKVRTLLPDPYSAVLTPMQANNRVAAAQAMANAKAAAAAMSVVAAPQPGGGWPGAGLLPGPASHGHSSSAPPPQPQYTLSPQQQQYLQFQQQQQQQQQQQLHQQQQQQGSVPQQPHSAGSTMPTTLQAANLGLSDRFEQLKKRFRKKSVTDADLQDGSAAGPL